MTATNRSFQVVAAIVVGTLLLANVVRGERPMTFGRTTRSSRRAQSNGDCVAENDLLRDIEALYDPTDYAIYSSEESDGQEGRAFDDLVVYNDTFYDASAVGALLQPVCELYGGIFYLLELELTCGGSPHIERTPHCTGASCNRSQLVALLVNQISEPGECDVTRQEITEPDPILADECALATSTLVAKQPGDTGSFGIGDPNYLANDVEYDDFCTEANNEGTRVCNFTSIHDDLQMRCEARKGYLYEVTEFIQSISYQDGVILSNETDYGVGYPFCIPQACDGDSFIRDVFIPTQHFYLNSTLIWYEDHSEGGKNGPTKGVDQFVYTIESISPISNVEKVVDETPTAAPHAESLSPISTANPEVPTVVSKAPTVAPLGAWIIMQSTALALMSLVLVAR